MGSTPTGSDSQSRGVSTADRVRAASSAADVAQAIETSDVDVAEILEELERNSERRNARNDGNIERSNAVKCNLTRFGGTFHDIDSGDVLTVRTLDAGIFIEPYRTESDAVGD